MRDKIKVQLSISLINDSVEWNNIDECINNFNDANIVGQDDTYLVYKRNAPLKNPKWLDVFYKKIWNKEEFDCFQTASEGLTLFIKTNNNDKDYIFAINFGTGRFSLNKDKINKDFGICVAHKLFIKQKGQLVSSEIRSNEQNPVNKKKSYGKEIDYNSYSIDLLDNDSIRSLSIKTDLKDFSKIIGKYESLKIHLIFDEREIPCLLHIGEKLNGLIDIYNSVTKEDKKLLYKGLVPITSDEIIYMDNKLEKFLKEIKDTDTDDNTFILFPYDDDFDTTEVSSFSYCINNERIDKEYETLWLKNYIEIQENITLDNLKQDKVFVQDTDGRTIREWTIYEILYGELKKDDNTMCILSNGIWLETDKEKYDRINNNVDSILDDSFEIDENIKDETTKKILEEKKKGNNQIFKERIFNKFLCSKLLGEFFDEPSKQISFEGEKIEICDIYLPSANEFIHTKIKHNSSNLGHLFNQAFVSGKTFYISKSIFLEKVNALIQNPNNKLNSNNCSDYNVRFLILNPKTTNKLSYLTKMILDDVINDLRAYGFTVKLTWVNKIELNPKLTEEQN